MSQNKTVIQGLEPADAPGGYTTSASPNFYQRATGRPQQRGTVVPGMTDNFVGGQAAAPQAAKPQTVVMQAPQPQRHVQLGKPVVGFLYSVSRTAAGEYWPLQIGQNTIGQNPDGDIVLSEGTVSFEHATLVVRKMKKPEKVIASIMDARSTNGTMLNGESLGFSAVECKNGDIITIGDNYELFLILIDPASLGLAVNENFIPVEVEEPQDNLASGLPPIPGGGFTRPGEGYQPFGGGTGTVGGYSAGGTVGFDGSSSTEKGGTIGI